MMTTMMDADSDRHQCLVAPKSLTGNVVKLKFHNSVAIWMKHLNARQLRYKVSALDVTRAETYGLNEFNTIQAINSVKHSDHILISVLNDTDFKFRGQQLSGHLYNENEFVIFRTVLDELEKTAYLIDFYYDESEAVTAKHIGICVSLPLSGQQTTGTTTMPIIGDNRLPIGQLKSRNYILPQLLNLEYLIINPLLGETELNESKKIWNSDAIRGIDIGHRGSGYARRTDRMENVLENTIASFNYASNNGADMVELDVQLSKDKIPIIYHDYHVNIAIKQKNSNHEIEYYQLQIKDLTHQQMQLLKLNPVLKVNKKEYEFHDDDVDDNQPFPSLQKTLESVNQNCGFNVEIKYPQEKIDGVWEADKCYEMNEYVDIILTTLFKYAKNRDIILSCFHPDVCSMLKEKQNRFPVLFLSQGQTAKYEPFKDYRNSSVKMATYFAASIDLLGVDVHAEDIIGDRSLIGFVKSKGLLLFCWGEDLNNKKLISDLKKEGVDGVIYDKVDLLSEKSKYVLDTENSINDSINFPNILENEKIF